VEPDEVHLVAAAVSCDSQHIIHAPEPRFTGQIVRDVGDGNRRNRIHDDVALVHPIPATDLYMGTRPDANAASDSPAPDSFAKAFGEFHRESKPRTAGRSIAMRDLDLSQREARTVYLPLFVRAPRPDC
jgi:hypothetical protein